MITHYIKTGESEGLTTAPKPVMGGWTHVVEPSQEELNHIIAEFDLDEAIVADIQDAFEVPRYEQDGTVSYFFTRYLNNDEENDIDISPLLIIIGSTFLITIADQEVPFIGNFILKNKDFSTTQKTNLFLLIMSTLISSYGRSLYRVRKSVHRDLGRVRNIRGRDIQRFVHFEQEVNEILSALLPTNAWLQLLTKGNYIQMFSEDKELLDDVLIASSQFVDSAKSILKTIQNIRAASEAYLTQKLNSTIRMLTAFTIILTIPTLIASLFGMNVPVPLAENPHGFWIILGIILTVVGITLHFFTRNRWI
jgi:magnesium transporter